MTPKGMQRMMAGFASFVYENDGTASWLDKPGPGPFDGPESLALAERCILGFSAGPPMLPGLYNNFKRIVQTDTHVMILMEMVHDARVVRLDSKHIPADQRQWLGDSIGWWEGDTLVVDTTNFREETGLYGGDENLHLVEKLHAPARRQPALQLHRHRPHRLDRALERRVHLEGEHRARLRVRLPRGQLRDGQHPARRAAAREGVQGQGRRGGQ